MNLFKKLFSKRKKVEETREDLIVQMNVNNYDSAYGDTVMLNNNESCMNNNDSNDKTVLLNCDQSISENDDWDLQNMTVALNQEQSTEFEEPPECYQCANQNNDDTVILSQNRDSFHAGDTVVLNKCAMVKKCNESCRNSFLINPSTGEKFLISSGEYKIGNDETIVDLVISKQGISRHHASIFTDKNNDKYIVDNGSTNGTEIEGEELIPFKEYLLENGVLIMFANEVFQFFVEE